MKILSTKTLIKVFFFFFPLQVVYFSGELSKVLIKTILKIKLGSSHFSDKHILKMRTRQVLNSMPFIASSP